MNANLALEDEYLCGMFVSPALLLASQSPRRHQILQEAGFDFQVLRIEADEDFDPTMPPERVCEFLAEHKSMHYHGAISTKVLVTADTIVWIDGQVLNKPADATEAKAMLRQLSGRTHEVYTGVCLRNDQKTKVFQERTQVKFHPLSDEEIEAYIASGSPFDKAGSYGIQDWMGYLGVAGIEGCFYNVMGFPVSRFYRELQAFCQEG
jgi:septum formation protein